MAASDPVACYYTGQDYRWERPAEIRTRAEVREMKNSKLGKFVENGKIFLFFKSIKDALCSYFDGPMGRGNILPFAKPNSLGEKLHYEMPMAGDRGLLRRHGLHREKADSPRAGKFVTRTLSISGRIAPELAALAAY